MLGSNLVYCTMTGVCFHITKLTESKKIHCAICIAYTILEAIHRYFIILFKIVVLIIHWFKKRCSEVLIMTMAKLILKFYTKVWITNMKLFACWKICLIFMHLCGCVYLGVYCVCTVLAEVLDFLEPEGPAVIRQPMLVLGTVLRSRGTASVPNCWAIAPAVQTRI